MWFRTRCVINADSFYCSIDPTKVNDNRSFTGYHDLSRDGVSITQFFIHRAWEAQLLNDNACSIHARLNFH